MKRRRRDSFADNEARMVQLIWNCHILHETASQLLFTLCSAEAATQALHPMRWHKQRTRRPGEEDIIPAVRFRESPWLLVAAKHLVAVAKRYCPKLTWPKLWSYEKMAQRRGTTFADSEVKRRDAIFNPKIAAVERHIKRLHASNAACVGASAFLYELIGLRNSYHP